jgi:hypothetical protein
LHARHIVVIGSGGVQRADNYVKAQVVRRRVLIEAYLKVLPCVVVGKEHRAPFDVEDAVRRAA